MNDIIVGIMIVIAVFAGAWCYWLERPAKNDNEKGFPDGDESTARHGDGIDE